MLYNVSLSNIHRHVLPTLVLQRVLTLPTQVADIVNKLSSHRLNSTKGSPPDVSAAHDKGFDDRLKYSRGRSVIRSPPSTKWELLQDIRRLLSLTPAAPFSRLLSLHRRYRTLQSVESYNLLLLLSIRHSSFGSTQSLIGSMAANQIKPDELTEKLVVRHLVSNGYWKMAWQQVMRRYVSVANIPIPVLLELLAPGTRNHFRRNRISTRLRLYRQHESTTQSQPRVPQSSILGPTSPEFEIPLDAHLLVLHRFPTLPFHELGKLPPRVVSYVVRGLIRNGHDGPALLLTEKHLKSLPSTLSPRAVEFARDLVHLHLTSGELKLANYKRRRRLVERLFSLHPSLHPNAKTVFLLMRYMKRSKRCGIEAYLFFKNYRTRWGAVVESLDVRRRLIQYALKQRKYGIAKEISQMPPLDELSIPSKPRRTAGDSLRVLSWRHLYPRIGKSKRLWRRTFIQLLARRRAWNRKKATIRWPKPSFR